MKKESSGRCGDRPVKERRCSRRVSASRAAFHLYHESSGRGDHRKTRIELAYVLDSSEAVPVVWRPGDGTPEDRLPESGISIIRKKERSLGLRARRRRQFPYGEWACQGRPLERLRSGPRRI